MTRSDIAGELGWMLDDLVERVGDVRTAMVLSRDGLIMATTRGMDRENAEFLAALAAGFFSLAAGARDHLEAGEVRQAVIELEEGLFFVVPAGVNSCLALLSRAGSDAGLVSYEMTMLVRRVSRHLAARPRGADLGAG
ncbi:roadblock/LC7 domain-containing protein [Actinomadura parmotrematis]|uniref:Roadblock/LC7 domain-containing protein n=1 Tax=Actinomadura parmotrematis TaxID=2864039 RepID=A0ABS7G0G2_9ACTN|nr:roadblock/LC7 domain-containing protein [Actinomadura parmotrematis]MBW8486199.1 roadblock/LC7 domain-containing protein [Actinomadura parmotrematis]